MTGRVSEEERRGPHLVADEGDAEWAGLAARVEEMSTAHAPFYVLVTLSTTIAAYGLLANSTAVVIGAMLVAPLMGPIFGIGHALATGDTNRLGRSVGAELRGTGLAIALAWLIGTLAPNASFGNEILSRTHPTLYDLIVALASGLAGAYALTDRRVSVALPGVAIATAIVPPLATAGLCLSAGRLEMAGGALLLFVVNLVAIEVAAVAWFTWVGVRRGHLHEHFRPGAFLQHFGVSLVLLGAMGVFTTRALLATIATERRRDRIATVLGDEVRITQGARIDQITTERRGDTLDVLAVVLTPQEILPEQVARLEQHLASTVEGPARLIVRSIISRDADRHGAVFLADQERARLAETAAQTAFLSRAAEVLRRRFAALPGVELEELRRDRLDSMEVVTAVVRTPVALGPAQVDSLDGLLDIALDAPVRLVVRSVLTRVADARAFLYEPSADSLAVDPPGTAGSRPRPAPPR